MNLEEIEVESALVRMKQEHRDLDDAIVALGVTGTFDQLQVQRIHMDVLRGSLAFLLIAQVLEPPYRVVWAARKSAGRWRSGVPGW